MMGDMKTFVSSDVYVCIQSKIHLQNMSRKNKEYTNVECSYLALLWSLSSFIARRTLLLQSL